MNQRLLDLDLSEEQIQDLSSREAVAAFFASLGYNTAARTRQTPANLGISAETLAHQIRHAELLADQDSLLQVYLFELTSVTIAATRGLARAFRNRAGNFLLVLTSDYERLDFVLVERFVPEGTSPTAPVGRREAGVRPRILTVERLKPGRVEMRVLRRFTYTESDPLAQYEKLLSAYTVADWSAEHFNNRALFSDYYLTERLRETTEWREDDPREAYLAFRNLFDGARTRWAGKTEGDLRQGILEPALQALGFAPVPAKRSREQAAPDYLLRSPDGGEGDLAVCLAYPWGRSLDGKDYTRDNETPEENPGAMVLSLLQDGAAKWAVATNGKHWRLYSARTHSRATNYYEVDLEEVLATEDPSEAFRYFWLLFRRQAFAPRTVVKDGQEHTTTFLDLLLEGSEDYAKRLGERLKERVFEEIFPHLARGFVEYRKAREGIHADLSQEALDQVFQGTLTFLYRLLFLLYAEARDLLPAKEPRGYYQQSLTRIKREVAQAIGHEPDKAARRLQAAYREDSAELYDRLLALFRVIDRGDSTLNVPVYDGGLFISDPEPDDDTPEATNARFLLANRVPDRHLAAALDLLARDEDEKTFKRVFIDYKSLGVRQLGSIYEGLLEFHLRVAPEKMAVCKGKKTEEIIPYREAVRTKRQILRQGRGKDAPERTLPRGAIYLENTRHERKATGSYYTPDYIVKYIVEHTVGPVLQEKFEAVRPGLREAQKAYRDAVKRREGFRKVGQEGDNPEKVANEYRHVVDELFDIKVLDPAMGSGHFLVEAVDFITDRMIDFLNAFPWNPVTNMLRQTRETILREMDEQGITIDPGRLTDVNLLKRHVLKRCIYGVDLNPMAVELAKVSLWLDCFTLGAPLSFLDHHLRWGNSLIGARVEEVEQALRADKVTGRTQAHLQLSLQAGPLVGLLSATEMMRRVGELSDVTARMVAESRVAYHKALDALAPIKRALDLYVAQWFVNSNTQRARRRGQPAPEHPLLRFLRADHAQPCIEDPAACATLPEEERELVARAFAEAAQRRFFHWELEFPEVWYEKGQRKENPGVDAVIGNPPYVGFHGARDTRPYLQARFFSCRGRFDIYVPFVEQVIHLLCRRGTGGMICPSAFMKRGYGEELRTILSRDISLRSVVDFKHATVFEEVTNYTCILVFQKGRDGEPHFVYHEGGIDVQPVLLERERAAAGPWVLEAGPLSGLVPRLLAAENSVPLGDLAVSISEGIVTGCNDVFVVDTSTIREWDIEEDVLRRRLSGSHIHAWRVDWRDDYVIYPYRVDAEGNAVTLTEAEFRSRFPRCYRYLCDRKERLAGRPYFERSGKLWYELWNRRSLDSQAAPKIVVPEIEFSNKFALAPEVFFYGDTVCGIVLPAKLRAMYRYLLGVLNSRLMSFVFRQISVPKANGYLIFKPLYLKQMPIHVPDRSPERLASALTESEPLGREVLEYARGWLASGAGGSARRGLDKLDLAAGISEAARLLSATCGDASAEIGVALELLVAWTYDLTDRETEILWGT